MRVRELQVRQQLDDDPRYRGSIHDDEVARAKGYPAALVPGAFIYGHVSRLGVLAWGEEYAARGSLSVRFRRPVFNGDVLHLTAEPEHDDNTKRAVVAVANAQGEIVASGDIALPTAGSALSIAESIPDGEPQPLAVGPGEVPTGTIVWSTERELTDAELARSRRAFGEDEAIYIERGWAHSGCLMRIAMAATNACFRFPAPVILTAAAAEHVAPVRAGERIGIVGRVTRSFERNGRHYFDSEERLLVTGHVAVRFRRTTLYG